MKERHQRRESHKEFYKKKRGGNWVLEKLNFTMLHLPHKEIQYIFKFKPRVETRQDNNQAREYVADINKVNGKSQIMEDLFVYEVIGWRIVTVS